MVTIRRNDLSDSSPIGQVTIFRTHRYTGPYYRTRVEERFSKKRSGN